MLPVEKKKKFFNSTSLIPIPSTHICIIRYARLVGKDRLIYIQRVFESSLEFHIYTVYIFTVRSTINPLNPLPYNVLRNTFHKYIGI